MKDVTVITRDSVKEEGYTQLEKQSEIRRRAFQLYEQRGRVDGYALTDWLSAEAQLEALDQGSKAVAA